MQKQQYHTHKLKETKANEGFKKLESMALLLMYEVNEDVGLQALDISRASYYRWKHNFNLYGIEGLEDASKRPDSIRKPTWTREIEQRIFNLRKEFPLFGKQKIAAIYKRRYKDPLSESTIGRILTHPEFPFKIKSIQVDGGSEFMADFEKDCKKANIPLYVLPTGSPECNGTVERGNGIAKYEFYARLNSQPSLHIIRKRLQEFAQFYNHVRPHQGIGLLTPNEFFDTLKKGGLQSHMR